MAPLALVLAFWLLPASAEEPKLPDDPLLGQPTQQTEVPVEIVDLDALTRKLQGAVPKELLERLRSQSENLAAAKGMTADNAFSRSAEFFDSYAQAVGSSALPPAQKRALIAAARSHHDALKPLPQKGAGIDSAQIPLDAGKGGAAYRDALAGENVQLAAQSEFAGQILRNQELAKSYADRLAANSRFAHDSAAADAARAWLQKKEGAAAALKDYARTYAELEQGKIDREQARRQLQAFQRGVAAKMDAAPEALEEKNLFVKTAAEAKGLDPEKAKELFRKNSALQDFYRDNPEYAGARATEAQAAQALLGRIEQLPDGTVLRAADIGMDRLADGTPVPPDGKLTRATEEGFPGLLVEANGLKRFASFDLLYTHDYARGEAILRDAGAKEGEEGWVWQRITDGSGGRIGLVARKHAAKLDYSRFRLDDKLIKRWFVLQGHNWVPDGHFEYLQIDERARTLLVREAKNGGSAETNYYILSHRAQGGVPVLHEEHWVRVGEQFVMMFYDEYDPGMYRRKHYVLDEDKHKQPFYRWAWEHYGVSGNYAGSGEWNVPKGVKKEYTFWDGFKIATADRFAYKYIVVPVGKVFGVVGEAVVGGVGAAGAYAIGSAESAIGMEHAGSLTKFNAYLQANKSSPWSPDSRDIVAAGLDISFKKPEDKAWYVRDQRQKLIEARVAAEAAQLKGLSDEARQPRLFAKRREIEQRMSNDITALVNDKEFADFVLSEGGASDSMQRRAFGAVGADVSGFLIELGKGAAGGAAVGRLASLGGRVISTPRMMAIESRLAFLNKPVAQAAFMDKGMLGKATQWLTGKVGTQPGLNNLGRALTGVQHAALAGGSAHDTLTAFGDVISDPSPETIKALARMAATNLAFMAAGKGDKMMASRPIKLPKSSDFTNHEVLRLAGRYKDHFNANQEALAGSGRSKRPAAPTAEGAEQAKAADATVAKAFAEYNQPRLKKGQAFPNTPENGAQGTKARAESNKVGFGTEPAPLGKAQIDAAIKKGTLVKGVDEVTLQNGETCTIEAAKNQFNAARPDLNLTTDGILAFAAHKFGGEFAHAARTRGLSSVEILHLQKAIAADAGVGLKVVPPERLFKEIAATGQGASVGIQVGDKSHHEVHVLGIADGHVVFLDSAVGGRTTLPIDTFAKALRSGGLMVNPKGKPNPNWAADVAAFKRDYHGKMARERQRREDAKVDPMHEMPDFVKKRFAPKAGESAGPDKAFDRWLLETVDMRRAEVMKVQPDALPRLLDNYIAEQKLSTAEAQILRRSLAGGSGAPPAAAAPAPKAWKNNFPDPASFDTDAASLRSKPDQFRVKGDHGSGMVIREDFKAPGSPDRLYCGQDPLVIRLMLEKGVFAPRMYHEGRSLKDLGGVDAAMRKQVTGDTSAFISTTRRKESAGGFGRFVLEIDPKKGDFYSTADLSERINGEGTATKESEYITQQLPFESIKSIRDMRTDKIYDLTKPADRAALRVAAADE